MYFRFNLKEIFSEPILRIAFGSFFRKRPSLARRTEEVPFHRNAPFAVLRGSGTQSVEKINVFSYIFTNSIAVEKTFNISNSIFPIYLISHLPFCNWLDFVNIYYFIYNGIWYTAFSGSTGLWNVRVKVLNNTKIRNIFLGKQFWK